NFESDDRVHWIVQRIDRKDFDDTVAGEKDAMKIAAAADFEEDVDVTSGSVPGVTLRGDSLGSWKESVIPFRWRGSNQGHTAVTLGWNRRIAGDDTTKRGQPATYALSLGDSLRGAWRIDGGSTLVFSLAPTDAKPGPRQPPRDTTKQGDSTQKAKPKAATKPPAKANPDTTPIDLSIEAVDADGRSASVPLSAYGVPRRPLESYVFRRAGRDKQRFATTYELVLQTYAVPLADFARVSPGFDPSRLATVRWRFDRADAGTVILDNIGFSRMPPDFYAPGAGAGR
ncbi:MAG: hypothetical protein ACLGIK_15345, partial [Gemmatimonadota bacterium]